MRLRGVGPDDDGSGKICGGKINPGGMCWVCKTKDGPACPSFSFKSEIAQIEDEDNKLTVICAAKAGTTMFGCEASEWLEKSEQEKLDAIESISGVGACRWWPA